MQPIGNEELMAHARCAYDEARLTAQSRALSRSCQRCGSSQSGPYLRNRPRLATRVQSSDHDHPNRWNQLALAIVPSLSRPGGNITGSSVDVGPEIWGKRLELLSGAAPKLSRLEFIITTSQKPNARQAMSTAQVFLLTQLTTLNLSAATRAIPHPNRQIHLWDLKPKCASLRFALPAASTRHAIHVRRYALPSDSGLPKCHR
jgi:hypothetical protein